MTPVLPDPQADPAGFVLAVADLREMRAREASAGPWCPTWTRAAIRHVQRNVDIDCEDHNPDGGAVGDDCRRFGRYDGEHIAAEANPAHALAEVALWRLIATKHRAEAGMFPPTCPACAPIIKYDEDTGGETEFLPLAPCDHLLAAAAACRAYAGGQ